MSKEKLTKEVPDTDSKVRVLSGGFQGRLRPARIIRQKKLLIGIGGLIIVVVAGYFLYEYFRPKEPEIDMTGVIVEQIPDEYAVMNPNEVGYSLYRDTGLTLQNLESRTIDGNLLPTYEKAYIAGQALLQVNKRQKALEAYDVAAEKAGDNMSYEFALKYIEVALLAGAHDKALAMIERAKSIINGNEELTAEGKQDEVDKLNQLRDDIKAGNH